MFLFNNIRKESLGIDISTEEIRFLKAYRKNHEIFITAAKVTKLPSGVISEGKIICSESLIKILKDLVESTNSFGLPACISIPEAAIFSKKIYLEDEKLLRNSKNICNYFKEMNSSIAYDYVPEKASGEWMLIATRRDELKNYINVLDSVSVNVCIVDVDVYALLKAFFFCCIAESKKNITILKKVKSILEIINVHGADIISRDKVSLNHLDYQKQINQLTCVGEKYAMQDEIFQYCDAIKVVDPFEKVFFDLSIDNSLGDFAATFIVSLGLVLRGLNL